MSRRSLNYLFFSMALTTTDKNLLIAAMERSIADACEAAGVGSLAAVETQVSALRTAFVADPSTVTGAQIDAAATALGKLVFPATSNIAAVFTEAKTAV